MSTDENRTAPNSSQTTRIDDAVFLGWQKTGSGEFFPLYNIIAEGHPSAGSTVTSKTLEKLNLQIPDSPLPQEPVK